MLKKIITTGLLFIGLINSTIMTTDNSTDTQTNDILEDGYYEHQGGGFALNNTRTSIQIKLKKIMEISNQEVIKESEVDEDKVIWTGPVLSSIETYVPQENKIVPVNCASMSGLFTEKNQELAMNWTLTLEAMVCKGHVTIDYLNTSLLVPQKSVKFSIRMSNWLFTSRDNQLHIKFEVEKRDNEEYEHQEEQDNGIKFREDENDSDGELEKTTEKVMKEYGKKHDTTSKKMNLGKYFMDFPTKAIATIDGSLQEVQVTINPSIRSQKVLIITFPYFEEIYYDPVMGDTTQLMLLANSFDQVSSTSSLIPNLIVTISVILMALWSN